MNPEKLAKWMDGVLEHRNSCDILANDRKILKKMMVDHLSNFFEWDVIEFSDDFNTIKLVWKYGIEPIIKVDTIQDLGIDFIMGNEFYMDLGQCNTIELCPFGLPKEGKIVRDD